MGRSKHYVSPSNLKRSARRLVHQLQNTVNILKKILEQTKDTSRNDMTHEKEGKERIKLSPHYLFPKTMQMVNHSSSLLPGSSQGSSLDNIGRSL